MDIDYSLKENPDCLQLGASVLELFTGKNFGQIIEMLRGEDSLAMLKKEKDIHKAICEFLDSIMHERGNRLVIFIDELDRCKPEYAVKLLERVKHYFENDSITFVFSTNMKELQHTIRRYYGENFNACKYLVERIQSLCGKSYLKLIHFVCPMIYYRMFVDFGNILIYPFFQFLFGIDTDALQTLLPHLSKETFNQVQP